MSLWGDVDEAVGSSVSLWRDVEGSVRSSRTKPSASLKVIAPVLLSTATTGCSYNMTLIR